MGPRGREECNRQRRVSQEEREGQADAASHGRTVWRMSH
jgi:hypothetical protein